jgi:hypothetical protein
MFPVLILAYVDCSLFFSGGSRITSVEVEILRNYSFNDPASEGKAVSLLFNKTGMM